MNLRTAFEKILNKKVILMLLALGIILMIFAGKTQPTERNVIKDNIKTGEIDVKQLENTLKLVDGVKKASVYVTYRNNGENKYVYDIKSSNDQRDLLVKFSDDTPIVSETLNPKVEGILVIVRGQGLDAIKLTNIIKGATGVPLHRICVEISKG